MYVLLENAYMYIPLQVTPSPVKPLLHKHMKLPGVSMHLALGLQLSRPESQKEPV